MSIFIDSAISLFSKIDKIMKFPLISPENKFVTLLKIYFVNLSNLLLFDLEIKQTVLNFFLNYEEKILIS